LDLDADIHLEQVQGRADRELCATDDRGHGVIQARRTLMKTHRRIFRIAVLFMLVAAISPCLLAEALAFRGERRGYEREGAYIEGPRGGAAAVSPYGGVAVRGPEGNVAVGRTVGDRVAILPDNASAVAVDDQMYYVDSSGVYYLPCADDNTVYCVVPAPQ
jgi:hypothetical protein